MRRSVFLAWRSAYSLCRRRYIEKALTDYDPMRECPEAAQ
jgi:hypothetical protein